MNVSDYREAKREGIALAKAMGWVLGQDDRGPVLYRQHALPRRWRTWLSAWTWLSRVYADRVRDRGRQR